MIEIKNYLNLSKLNWGDVIEEKSLNLFGEVTMPVLNILGKSEFDYLDISECEFGFAYETHWTCLGWGHSGPVERASYRKVEMLRKFLETIRAKTILLPDEISQRHINSARCNKYIQELQVNDTCPLFAYEDGKLMNKKKTKPVFGCQLITLKGEVRGKRETFHPTIDVIFSYSEVARCKALVKDNPASDFISIIKDDLPKLSDIIDRLFREKARKLIVHDGMDYEDLSKNEVEKAEIFNDKYEVFVPEEFKAINNLQK